MDIEIQPRDEEEEQLERSERPELVVPSREIVRPMVADGVAKCWYQGAAGNPARLLADGQKLYEGDRSGGMVWHNFTASSAFTLKLETNGASRMNFFVLLYDSWVGSMGTYGNLLTRRSTGLAPDSDGWTACQIETTSSFKAGKAIGVGGVPLERNCVQYAIPECIDCTRVFIGLSLPKQATLPSSVYFGGSGQTFGYFDSVTSPVSNLLVFTFRNYTGYFTQNVVGPYTAVSMSKNQYVNTRTKIANIKSGLPASDRIKLTISGGAWSKTISENVATVVPYRTVKLDESHVSAAWANVAPSINTSTGEFGYYHQGDTRVYASTSNVSFISGYPSLSRLYCW